MKKIIIGMFLEIVAICLAMFVRDSVSGWIKDPSFLMCSILILLGGFIIAKGIGEAMGWR